MRYMIASFTHKNTNIETREKLSFSDKALLKRFYDKLLSLAPVHEAVVVSTCNRVEVIISTSEVEGVDSQLLRTISEVTGVSLSELEGKGAIYTDANAIHHIFSVVSSLDSLVLGETQIVGQVKDAFSFSYDNGYSGQKIARVMHNAFRCSATVRNATDISKNPISVASVAVARAKEIFGGNLGGYSAVVVGTGEMGELACKHLANAGANIILVTRNIEKGQEMAKRIDNVTVTVEPFSELPQLLNHYRLLFSATSATEPVIRADMIEETTFERHWFDIAIPRDIEDGDYPDITIYAVDDLRTIMHQNLKQRESSAMKAYAIVGEFTEDFFKWLQSLSVDPMIREIRDMARNCSSKELQRAIKKGYVPKEYEKQIEKIIHQAFNSFLHKPTTVLKHIADQPQADTVVQSIQLFFGLNSEQRKALDTYKCDYQIEKDLYKKENG
ncbi:MAG TPA: glutamyl-tRNA reductase [Campylobacteraceae bacterium]|jgi:glutamyl-tRNA reductase|nr:glutamyl-tRNA reductase [Campylobacteraceae bacterium]